MKLIFNSLLRYGLRKSLFGGLGISTFNTTFSSLRKILALCFLSFFYLFIICDKGFAEQATQKNYHVKVYDVENNDLGITLWAFHEGKSGEFKVLCDTTEQLAQCSRFYNLYLREGVSHTFQVSSIHSGLYGWINESIGRFFPWLTRYPLSISPIFDTFDQKYVPKELELDLDTEFPNKGSNFIRSAASAGVGIGLSAAAYAYISKDALTVETVANSSSKSSEDLSVKSHELVMLDFDSSEGEDTVSVMTEDSHILAIEENSTDDRDWTAKYDEKPKKISHLLTELPASKVYEVRMYNFMYPQAKPMLRGNGIDMEGAKQTILGPRYGHSALLIGKIKANGYPDCKTEECFYVSWPRNADHGFHDFRSDVLHYKLFNPNDAKVNEDPELLYDIDSYEPEIFHYLRVQRLPDISEDKFLDFKEWFKAQEFYRHPDDPTHNIFEISDDLKYKACHLAEIDEKEFDDLFEAHPKDFLMHTEKFRQLNLDLNEEQKILDNLGHDLMLANRELENFGSIEFSDRREKKQRKNKLQARIKDLEMQINNLEKKVKRLNKVLEEFDQLIEDYHIEVRLAENKAELVELNEEELQVRRSGIITQIALIIGTENRYVDEQIKSGNHDALFLNMHDSTKRADIRIMVEEILTIDEAPKHYYGDSFSYGNINCSVATGEVCNFLYDRHDVYQGGLFPANPHANMIRAKSIFEEAMLKN